MTTTTPDAGMVKEACDAVVAASPDPTAARTAFLWVWLLGGMAGEDLLDDQVAVAVHAGHHRGQELTFAEVLDALDQHERAQRVREAVDAGRAAWLDAAARVVRVHDVTTAREAA